MLGTNRVIRSRFFCNKPPVTSVSVLDVVMALVAVVVEVEVVERVSVGVIVMIALVVVMVESEVDRENMDTEEGVTLASSTVVLDVVTGGGGTVL